MKIIDANWLNKNLNSKNLVILDASIEQINKTDYVKNNLIIPKARKFDIDTNFSDLSNPLPHTLLKQDIFINEMRNLGISNNSKIIIYDDIGFYSTPRAYFMIKEMGFEEVYILDKGFSNWQKNGFEVSIYETTKYKKGNFSLVRFSKFFCDIDEVLKNYENKKCKIIDARSKNRFLGLEEEPREGLKKGHIPNAINLPYTDVLEDNSYKSKEKLNEIFSKIATKEDKMIFYCGSGVTACITAGAAKIAGYNNILVYDGSWSQWGLISENYPISR